MRLYFVNIRNIMLKRNISQISAFIDGRIKLIPINTYFVEADDCYQYKLGGEIQNIDKSIVEKSQDIFIPADVSAFVKSDLFERFDKKLNETCLEYFSTILDPNVVDFNTWKFEFITNFIMEKFGEVKAESKKGSLKDIFFISDKPSEVVKWDIFKNSKPPIGFKVKLIE